MAKYKSSYRPKQKRIRLNEADTGKPSDKHGLSFASEIDENITRSKMTESDSSNINKSYSDELYCKPISSKKTNIRLKR